jgi:hypothetical protein
MSWLVKTKSVELKPPHGLFVCVGSWELQWIQIGESGTEVEVWPGEGLLGNFARVWLGGENFSPPFDH